MFEPTGAHAARGTALKTMKPTALARELGSISSTTQAKLTPMYVTAQHHKQRLDQAGDTKLGRAHNQHPVSVGDLHAPAVRTSTKGVNVFSSLQKTSLYNISALVPSSSLEAAQHHASLDQLARNSTERTVLNQSHAVDRGSAQHGPVITHSKLLKP